jgi:glycine C-acetyltransferase
MMHMVLEHLVKQELEKGEEQEFRMILMFIFNFAKSMANIGAFVAADKDIIDYLKYNLRSQMFAKAYL